MTNELNYDALTKAVAGSAAGFRCTTEYQPMGGPGDKVFPPTYDGGKYAVEDRIDPESGEIVHCVLLDSVQSQANRMELALLEAHRAGQIALPLVVTCFNQEPLLKKFTVSSLEAPHRVADALFRDSLLNGVIFRKSDKGGILDKSDVRHATGLFGLCPTALVFGLWDSTGPRGGLGAKFQRAIVSEIVGMHAVAGISTSGKVDSIPILKSAATLYERDRESRHSPNWTLNEDDAKKTAGKKGEISVLTGKEGKPSEVNLGGVTPSYSYAKRQGQIIYDTVVDDSGRERREPRIVGGFTISKAVQTTVLSLSALRRLRFPLGESADSDPRIDLAARVALTALGLTAATLARSDGDLRSRCQLFAQHAPVWDLLDRPGEESESYALSGETAIALLKQAISSAKTAGLPWEGVIKLAPHADLIELVRRSQELVAESGAEGD